MLTLLAAWTLVPLALAAVGAGWGALVERAASAYVHDALLIPLGLAAALVVAGTITAVSALAPAAVAIVAAGAIAGLVFAPPFRRLRAWPMLAAFAVLLVYGAPVLLSGHATFTGFVRLDDTSTWFNIVDHVFAHGPPARGAVSSSTYDLVYTGDVGPTYPLGAFMLPGIARALTRLDIAWAFQPYLASCAAALALCLHALLQPTLASPRVRALVAFAGAQAALLYGYGLWGGVKELTAAFLLALGVALAAAAASARPTRPRELLPLAVAAGALIQTLGVGAAAFVAPALLVLAACWLGPALRGARVAREPASAAVRPLAALAAATAAFALPLWIVIGDTLSSAGGGTTFSTLFSSGQSAAVKLGNLVHPLSVFQLAGIWPIGDFRLTAPTLSSALWVAGVLLAATGAIAVTLRRRELGLAAYAFVALGGCAVIYLAGGTPWVVGKALAISSPALLTAALAGAAALAARGRRARSLSLPGLVLGAALLGGVLYSNVLGYGDATLAPRDSLAELAHIGGRLHGHGPTFLNAYEIYGDRHFLRDGAPIEPAEYRVATLPLRGGAVLTKSAAADLDSFPLAVLAAYPSIVTPRIPAESRPPSNYTLAWQGEHFQLWQLDSGSRGDVLAHVPLGESNEHPYCGAASGAEPQPLCSVDPAATPACAAVGALAARAARAHAQLVAYERPQPIVARGDQTLWPRAWYHDPAGHTLTPTVPGAAVSHIALASDQRYELWLGGSFTRGFRVSVDGRAVGSVGDQPSAIDGYAHVADLRLGPGVHEIALAYPHPDLDPGSAESGLTQLTAIAFVPERPAARLLTLAPAEAHVLCGRSLDWIEIVSRG
jgi:hypothetical protein